MKLSTQQWIEATISKRLERISQGKEALQEERVDALLTILKAVSGDVPSLTSLSPQAKDWLKKTIEYRLDAIANRGGGELAEERLELLTEAYAALTRSDGGGGGQGPPGPQGPPGKDGQIRYTGQGPPGTIVGAQPGDTYLDTLTGDVYRLQ